MRPMVIRNNTLPQNAMYACVDCNGQARAVWLDELGALRLCDDCINLREAMYIDQEASKKQ